MLLPACLVPNYRADLGQVFRDVARLIIADEASLDILEDNDSRSNNSSDLRFPTWVPRWHNKRDYDLQHTQHHPTRCYADAQIEFDISNLHATVDLDVLLVKGVTLGVIEQASVKISRQHFVREGTKALKSFTEYGT